MNNLSAAKLMASVPKLHPMLLLVQLIPVVMVVPVEWKSSGTAALAETDTAIRSQCMDGAASTGLATIESRKSFRRKWKNTQRHIC